MRNIPRRGVTRAIIAAVLVCVAGLLAACGDSAAGKEDSSGSEGPFGDTVKVGLAVIPPFVIKDGDNVIFSNPDEERTRTFLHAVLDPIGPE